MTALRGANVVAVSDLADSSILAGQTVSGWNSMTDFTYVDFASFNINAVNSEVDLMAFADSLAAMQTDVDFIRRWTHNKRIRTVDGGTGAVTYTVRNDADGADYCYWTYDPVTGTMSAVVFV